MVLIQLWGGLGNQMFIYALYKKLNMLGRDVFLDDVELLKNGNQHNGAELKLAFGLDYRKCGNKCHQWYKGNPGIVRKINRKIFKKVGIYNHSEEYFVDKESFSPEIYDIKDGYLIGYWQSWKYFFDIRNDLLQDFNFQISELIGDERNKDLLKDITNTESVSIHVRRGDYLWKENERIFGDICDLEYYKKATELLSEKKRNCKFFIFSNDIDWCRMNFSFLGDCEYVFWNTGKHSYFDMFLMTKCKNNIIANSTFSWWGAYLNENEDKIVVAPEKWVNQAGKLEDIVPEKWIQI